MIPSECQALDDELRPVILVCVLAVGLVLALGLIMTADGMTTPLVGGAASCPRMHHNIDAHSNNHRRDKKQTLDLEFLGTHISEDDSRDANLDVQGLTPREIPLSASSSCRHYFGRWASHRARDYANTHSARQATIIQLGSTHTTTSKWQCTVSSHSIFLGVNQIISLQTATSRPQIFVECVESAR